MLGLLLALLLHVLFAESGLEGSNDWLEEVSLLLIFPFVALGPWSEFGSEVKTFEFAAVAVRACLSHPPLRFALPSQGSRRFAEGGLGCAEIGREYPRRVAILQLVLIQENKSRKKIGSRAELLAAMPAVPPTTMSLFRGKREKPPQS